MTKQKASLGELEQLILLAVLRLDEGAYAVSIGDELRAQASIETPRGAIYVTLDRLERKGMLRSRCGDPTPERGGKAKRYFQVTQNALPLLRFSQAALLNLWDGVDLGKEKA